MRTAAVTCIVVVVCEYLRHFAVLGLHALNPRAQVERDLSQSPDELILLRSCSFRLGEPAILDRVGPESTKHSVCHISDCLILAWSDVIRPIERPSNRTNCVRTGLVYKG